MRTRSLLWLAMIVASLLVLLLASASIPLARGHDDGDDADDDDTHEAVVEDVDGDGSSDDGEKSEEDYGLEGFSPEQVKVLQQGGETHHFEAEVSRLMKLIINSLYKNKEIFLRELISNASDALDKIRFISLTREEGLGDTPDLLVQIRGDEDKRILTITDTGIGMTREHLINNLGTIAKSGTSEFLQNVDENSDNLGLIGQFGVGFYSAFLVADKVTVVSKHDEDSQHIWQSDASGHFSVVEDPRGNTLGRGTQIILHMKDDAKDFLREHRLEELVKKYSEFINFPIYLYKIQHEEREEPLNEEELENQRKELEKIAEEEAEKKRKAKEEGDVEDVEEGEEEEEQENLDDVEIPTTKKVMHKFYEYIKLNEHKPIWIRSPSDVTEREYSDFYKAISKNEQDPLAYIHFKAEGEVEFRSILFIPPKAPNDLYQVDDPKDSIKLFVRHVFITDSDPEHLLPKYLKFITGMVDSDDLPLNVSRETLQQSKMLKVIKKKLTRKALEMMKKLSMDDPTKYQEFLKEFGTALKWGIIDDAANRNRLGQLVKFHSSTSGEESSVSLDDYISRMKKGQQHIYFLGGDTLDEINASPFMERVMARGYEVLLLPDPIDEYAVQALMEYEGFKFQNIAKEGFKFGDEDEEEKERVKHLEGRFKPLLAWLKEQLHEYVGNVAITNRLTTSPCALVASQFGWSGNMERIMKAQAYTNQYDPMTNFYATQKRTLEINPNHPVMEKLLAVVNADAADEITSQLAHILYDTAALRSGFALRDSVDFAASIENVVRINLGVDLNDKVEVNERPGRSRFEADPVVDDDEDEDDDEEEDAHDEL